MTVAEMSEMTAATRHAITGMRKTGHSGGRLGGARAMRLADRAIDRVDEPPGPGVLVPAWTGLLGSGP